MTTSVKVPNNVDAGAISISEVNCDKTCHGQIATVHVRDGSDQTPYLEWTLKVVASLNNPVVKHELDDGDRGAVLGLMHSELRTPTASSE